ncbi:hypothetical protein BDN70DRAFT_885469 [Pholiota conissans]|uniref:Uncharacterized protein n=1 Tax=Pholiota conissans TaxID=109636 RepID=A0A9P5YR00_9AGAR|nr:hypothetical protein BDN70DRAFT_885469 [Pholiota conissans]
MPCTHPSHILNTFSHPQLALYLTAGTEQDIHRAIPPVFHVSFLGAILETHEYEFVYVVPLCARVNLPYFAWIVGSSAVLLGNAASLSTLRVRTRTSCPASHSY